MLKKYYLNVASFIFVILFGVGLSFVSVPNSITSSNPMEKETDVPNKQLLNQIYDVNFRMSHTVPGNINTFFINWRPTTPEEAMFYSGMVGIDQNETETEDLYRYENDTDTLEVMKKVNMLKIIPKHMSLQSQHKIDQDEANQCAIDFLTQHQLFFNFEESVVTLENNQYRVTFLARLGNLKNFAFPNVVYMDCNGNVQEVIYYFLEYHKLDTIQLKSMKEAFLEMPTTFQDGTAVDLKGCQLVYNYEDSIVQPAYQFVGEMKGGKGFECFIKAYRRGYGGSNLK